MFTKPCCDDDELVGARDVVTLSVADIDSTVYYLLDRLDKTIAGGDNHQDAAPWKSS